MSVALSNRAANFDTFMEGSSEISGVKW